MMMASPVFALEKKRTNNVFNLNYKKPTTLSLNRAVFKGDTWGVVIQIKTVTVFRLWYLFIEGTWAIIVVQNREGT